MKLVILGVKVSEFSFLVTLNGVSLPIFQKSSDFESKMTKNGHFGVTKWLCFPVINCPFETITLDWKGLKE